MCAFLFSGVSRYLLVIVMANMMLYIAYYCGMKVFYHLVHKKSNEAINAVCIVYFLLSLVFMAVGVVFFSKELKNSALLPAESR